MEQILSFMVSVLAGVVANFISKRFDRDRSDNKEPED